MGFVNIVKTHFEVVVSFIFSDDFYEQPLKLSSKTNFLLLFSLSPTNFWKKLILMKITNFSVSKHVRGRDWTLSNWQRNNAFAFCRQCMKIWTEFLFFFVDRIIFQILEDTHKAQAELREIIQRHNLITDLEKSLYEVYEMFVQVSTLVWKSRPFFRFRDFATSFFISFNR